MIDWDRVAELQAELGEEDFIEVGGMFVAEMESRLQEMSEAAQQDAADFHYLRGSAANLGLQEFAQVCADAEASARAGSAVDLASLELSLRRALDEIGDLFAS
ncbi:MAG: Hpt domain-containing protein [Pseudomonadota bacterium]